MKIKILEYDLNASSYAGGHRKVQSHKKTKNGWKENKNYGIHKLAVKTPYCFNVKEYEIEMNYPSIKQVYRTAKRIEG